MERETVVPVGAISLHASKERRRDNYAEHHHDAADAKPHDDGTRQCRDDEADGQPDDDRAYRHQREFGE